MAKSKASGNIPMRLRRRRDGSLALTNAASAIGAADRVFPSHHLFTNNWLLGADGSKVVSIDGDVLMVTLVNASAIYRIDERTDAGLSCVLVTSDLFDAPPVKE